MITYTVDLPLIGVNSIKKISLIGGFQRFFFRYSFDGGLLYSEWDELTINPYMGKIVCIKSNFLILEYKVEGGSADFDIDIELEYIKPQVPAKYTELFPLKYLNFWNEDSINWSLNVLKKIINKGIVPNYIERTSDFSDLFFSIIYIQALRYSYNKIFSNLLHYRDLALKYARSKGLYLSQGSGIDEIYNSLKFFYDEISKRGSLKCFDIYPERGEVMKFIDSNEFDEKVIGLVNSFESGWVVNDSCPLYEGINPNLSNFIKQRWEFTKDFEALFEESPVVDPNLSYLVKVEFETSQKISLLISLGIKGWDSGKSMVVNTNFFSGVNLNLEANKPVVVWAVIYGKKIGDMTTSLALGRNLKFINSNICKMTPTFISSQTLKRASIEVSLLDYPETIYLENTRKLILFLKNNNKNISDNELRNILEERFIPITVDFNLQLL